jgi:hypothetical protein
MSQVVFEITKSYTIGSTVKTDTITFGPRQLGDKGLDILAVKGALGIVAPLNADPPANRAFEEGLWFDCTESKEISAADGSTFDKKMEVALTNFQFENRNSIVRYLLEGLVLTSDPEDTNGPIEDLLFSAELGTLGAATLSVLHGWRFRFDSFVDSSFRVRAGYGDPSIAEMSVFVPYSEDTQFLRNSLLGAPGTINAIRNTIPESYYQNRFKNFQEFRFENIIRRGRNNESALSLASRTALSLSPHEFDPMSTVPSPGTLAKPETHFRAFAPDPLIDPDPFYVNIRTMGYFHNTRFTYDSPPLLEGGEDYEAQQNELKQNALIEVLRFYNLPDEWILDPLNEAVTTQYPSLVTSLPNPPPTRVSAGRSAMGVNYQTLESPRAYESDFLGPAPLIKFVEFRSPSLRPGETYRALFFVNKMKLDLITTGTRTYTPERPQSAFDIPFSSQEQVETQRIAMESFLGSKLACTLGFDEKETEKRLQEFKSFAQKRKNEIARQIRQAALIAEGPSGRSIEVDLGPLGKISVQSKTDYISLADAVSAASTVVAATGELAAMASGKPEERENFTLVIERRKFKSSVKKASQTLAKLAPDLKGEDIRPKIDLEEESTLLAEAYNAVNNALKSTADYGDYLKTIIGVEINESDTWRPDIDVFDPGQPIFFIFKFKKVERIKGKVDGLRIESITVSTSKTTSADGHFLILSGELNPIIGRKLNELSPLSKPRTMGYFWQVDKLAKDNGGLDLSFLNGTKCEDLFGKQLKPGVAYVLKYTFPTTSLASKKSVFSPIAEFSRNTKSTVDEWWKSTEEELKKGDEEFAGAIVASAASAIPDFGPTCDLKKIYSKFLDPATILNFLCDYMKCIKLPTLNFGLDFSFNLNLPAIPRLPTFDLFAMLLAALHQAMIDAIVGILCSFAKTILDALKDPDCDSQFNKDLFGKVSLGDELAEAALTDFFTDTGLDNSLIDEAKDFISDLFKILTPREICNLLNGTASEQTLTAVRNFVKSSRFDSLENFFSSVDNIVYFFSSLGVFVDPAFCEELGEIDFFSIGDDCKDNQGVLEQVRRKLEEGSLTPEQMQAILDLREEEMNKRAAALAQALSGDALSNILPSLFDLSDPNAIVNQMPDAMSKNVDTMLESTFSNTKNAYVLELNSFVSSMYEQVKRLPEPGDDSYDVGSINTFEEAVEKLKLISLYMQFVDDYTHWHHRRWVQHIPPTETSMDFIWSDHGHNRYVRTGENVGDFEGNNHLALTQGAISDYGRILRQYNFFPDGIYTAAESSAQFSIAEIRESMRENGSVWIRTIAEVVSSIYHARFQKYTSGPKAGSHMKYDFQSAFSSTGVEAVGGITGYSEVRGDWGGAPMVNLAQWEGTKIPISLILSTSDRQRFIDDYEALLTHGRQPSDEEREQYRRVKRFHEEIEPIRSNWRQAGDSGRNFPASVLYFLSDAGQVGQMSDREIEVLRRNLSESRREIGAIDRDPGAQTGRTGGRASWRTAIPADSLVEQFSAPRPELIVDTWGDFGPHGDTWPSLAFNRASAAHQQHIRDQTIEKIRTLADRAMMTGGDALKITTGAELFPFRFFQRVGLSRQKPSNMNYGMLDPDRIGRGFRVNSKPHFTDGRMPSKIEFVDKAIYAQNGNKDRYDIFVSDSANNINRVFSYCDSIPENLRYLIDRTGQATEHIKEGMFNHLYIEKLQEFYPLTDDDRSYFLTVLSESNVRSPYLGDSTYASTFTFIAEKAFNPLFDNNGNLRGVPRTLKDEEYMKGLEARLSGQPYVIDECVVEPVSPTHKDTILSFNKITEKAKEIIKQEYKKPENSPFKQNFSQPTPYDKGATNVAIDTFIKVCLVEVMLKGVGYNSKISHKTFSSDKFFEDYLVEYITSYLLRNRIFSSNSELYVKVMMKLLNLSLPPTTATMKRCIALLVQKNKAEIMRYADPLFLTEEETAIDYLFRKLYYSDVSSVRRGDAGGAVSDLSYGLQSAHTKFRDGPDINKSVAKFFVEHYIRVTLTEAMYNHIVRPGAMPAASQVKPNLVLPASDIQGYIDDILFMNEEHPDGPLPTSNITIKYGARLVHTSRRSNNFGVFERGHMVLKTRVLPEEGAAALPWLNERTFSMHMLGDNSENPIICVPFASYEEDFECVTLENTDEFYEEFKPHMVKGLKNTSDVRTLFNFFFPMQRVCAVSNISSIAYASGYSQVADLMDTAKAALILIILILQNKNDFGMGQTALEDLGAFLMETTEVNNNIDSNASSDGSRVDCLDFKFDLVNEIMKTLKKQIERILREAPRNILRNLANELDPAYNEMRKHFLNCEPRPPHIKKLTTGALRATSFDMNNYAFGNPHVRLADGTYKKKPTDRGKYASILTAFPSELALAIPFLMVPDPSGITQLRGVKMMGGSIMKLINYVGDMPKFVLEANFQMGCEEGQPGEPLIDFEFQSKLGRYGHPIGPLGLLALMTGELRGEKIVNDCKLSDCDEDEPPGEAEEAASPVLIIPGSTSCGDIIEPGPEEGDPTHISLPSFSFPSNSFWPKGHGRPGASGPDDHCCAWGPPLPTEADAWIVSTLIAANFVLGNKSFEYTTLDGSEIREIPTYYSPGADHDPRFANPYQGFNVGYGDRMPTEGAPGFYNPDLGGDDVRGILASRARYQKSALGIYAPGIDANGVGEVVPLYKASWNAIDGEVEISPWPLLPETSFPHPWSRGDWNSEGMSILGKGMSSGVEFFHAMLARWNDNIWSGLLRRQAKIQVAMAIGHGDSPVQIFSLYKTPNNFWQLFPGDSLAEAFAEIGPVENAPLPIGADQRNIGAAEPDGGMEGPTGRYNRRGHCWQPDEDQDE